VKVKKKIANHLRLSLFGPPRFDENRINLFTYEFYFQRHIKQSFYSPWMSFPTQIDQIQLKWMKKNN
jgi:hypothetical protein